MLDPEVQPEQTEEEEEATPQMSVWMTIVLLVAVTTVRSRINYLCITLRYIFTQLVAVTAEWLVDSINGLASGGVISREFVGIILLPIVGNAAGKRSDVSVEQALKETCRACNSCHRFCQGQAYVEPRCCGWF